MAGSEALLASQINGGGCLVGHGIVLSMLPLHATDQVRKCSRVLLCAGASNS